MTSFFSATVQWCNGAMVQWCNGAMVKWCRNLRDCNSSYTGAGGDFRVSSLVALKEWTGCWFSSAGFISTTHLGHRDFGGTQQSLAPPLSSLKFSNYLTRSIASVFTVFYHNLARNQSRGITSALDNKAATTMGEIIHILWMLGR